MIHQALVKECLFFVCLFLKQKQKPGDLLPNKFVYKLVRKLLNVFSLQVLNDFLEGLEHHQFIVIAILPLFLVSYKSHFSPMSSNSSTVPRIRSGKAVRDFVFCFLYRTRIFFAVFDILSFSPVRD